MTLSFVVGVVVSLLKPEPRAEEGFAKVERRAMLGALADIEPEPRAVSAAG
jgi:hypothetical protein